RRPGRPRPPRAHHLHRRPPLRALPPRPPLSSQPPAGARRTDQWSVILGRVIELLVVGVLALAVIAGAAVAGPRLGVASPLVLVVIGVAASYLPVFSALHIEPEWILTGVLPPLLYSAAVSMPSMNFRREFGAIGGLSVLLVVGSALVLGVFFMLV